MDGQLTSSRIDDESRIGPKPVFQNLFDLKLEGFEPPPFGSGIRRATNCAIASALHDRLGCRRLEMSFGSDGLVCV